MVNYKSSIAGLASGGLFTVATWKTFIKGIFNGFAADYNLYDGALLVGFCAMLFAVILIVKDMVDGGKFTSAEKQRAMKAIGIMALLFAGGWLTAKYFAADQVLDPVYVTATGDAGDFRTTNGAGWAGGSQNLYTNIEMTYGTPYVVVGAANDTDYTNVQIMTNQSYVDWAFMQKTRGFNITVSEDGISVVTLYFYDGSAYNQLLKSDVDTAQFDVTDLGTTTEINCSWSLADILGWKASYTFDGTTDKITIKFEIGADFTETNAITINWYWVVTGSDLTYLLVVIMWCAAGLIPLAITLDLFNRKTYKRSYKRRSR